MESVMEKCEVLDIIISLLKGYKNISSNGDPFLHSRFKENDLYLWNTNYLLNQVIRQYNIPPERYLITKEAKALWDKITDEPITNYYYREEITAKFDGAFVQEYKGAQKDQYRQRTLQAGDKFIYKDIFHHEHVIPVIVIIRQLKELKDEELDYEHVYPILENMYICRMLKSEDREIKNKYNRPSDKDEVIKTVYEPAKVYVE